MSLQSRNQVVHLCDRGSQATGAVLAWVPAHKVLSAMIEIVERRGESATDRQW